MSDVAKAIIELRADTPVSSIVGLSITSLRYFKRKSRVIACRSVTLSMGITSICLARLYMVYVVCVVVGGERSGVM